MIILLQMGMWMAGLELSASIIALRCGIPLPLWVECFYHF
jgi:hypothetical protein